METYCVSREKNILQTKNQALEILKLLLDCTICGKKKLTFIKN